MSESRGERRPQQPNSDAHTSRVRTGNARAGGRFPAAIVYHAARLYYLNNATQAEIAAELGTSRPTVSRLLAEARESGIVEVRVRDPEQSEMSELEGALAGLLNLRAAYVTPAAGGIPTGALLAPAVGEALSAARLRPGDALLVSSGKTIYEIAQQPMPSLSGVVLCPTVGGVEEPEAHYQTNEITRALAMKVEGRPTPLYAPALPSPALHAALQLDPQFQRVVDLWKTSRAALLGVGAPPHKRSSLPSVISPHGHGMDRAVGDICARPYSEDGSPIQFPGADRLVAIELPDLRAIPHTIAVAAGAAKVESVIVGAEAGYFNTLVTDSSTAALIIATMDARKTHARNS